jgi:hypothetical protein
VPEKKSRKNAALESNREASNRVTGATRFTKSRSTGLQLLKYRNDVTKRLTKSTLGKILDKLKLVEL